MDFLAHIFQEHMSASLNPFPSSPQPSFFRHQYRDHSERSGFLREMDILKRLSHPHILQYVGMFCAHRQLHMVTEYIGGGTLFAYIADTGKAMPWDVRYVACL